MVVDSPLHIVYVIESAAYGIVFTSCFCENPNERGTREWGLLIETASECNPVQSSFYTWAAYYTEKENFHWNSFLNTNLKQKPTRLEQKIGDLHGDISCNNILNLSQHVSWNYFFF